MKIRKLKWLFPSRMERTAVNQPARASAVCPPAQLSSADSTGLKVGLNGEVGLERGLGGVFLREERVFILRSKEESTQVHVGKQTSS